MMSSFVYSKIDLSSTKQEVVDRSVNLLRIHAGNPGTETVYLQVFDAPAANVVVGTTVPDFVLMLPGGGGIDGTLPIGLRGGCTVAATTTANGSTAPDTAILVTIFYDLA